jgi:hypothetical protein
MDVIKIFTSNRRRKKEVRDVIKEGNKSESVINWSSIADIAQFAAMFMDIRYSDFMIMTPYEFSVALKLHKRKEAQREMEVKYKYQFDRYCALASLNVHLKTPIKNGKDFFPLWYEEEVDEQEKEDVSTYDVNFMFGRKFQEDKK